MTPNEKIAKLLQVSDLEAEKIIFGYEKELAKAYGAALRDVKQMIADMFEKYGDEVSFKDLVAYQRLTNLELAIAKQVKTLTGKGKRTVEKAFIEIAKETFEATGEAVKKGLSVSTGFGVLNEEVIKTAVINPMQRITWPEALQENSAKYLSQIKTELSQGLIRGEGYAKIAKRLEKTTEMSANKTIRIVRTEGHRAQSIGRNLAIDKVEGAAERLGVKVKRVWVATNDDRTRDSHRAMDGKEAEDDGLFTLPSGVRTEGPGMSGVAEEDINCRCTVRVEVG